MTAATTPGEGPESVLVVGAGLMGTSAALALTAAGCSVAVSDRDPRAEALAAALASGSVGLPETDPDVILVAVSPANVAKVVEQTSRTYLTSTLSDLASIKSLVQVEVEAIDPSVTSRFVGGHPLAGRERSGAGAARADLFDGRPWVLTPSAASDPHRVAQVSALVRLCGAQPVVMDAARHDEAVALVSHVPQLMASLVAARLLPADDDAVALAGQGIRDVTRVAASDPELWGQILATNAPAMVGVLEALAADLDRVLGSVRELGEARVRRAGDASTSAQRLVDLAMDRDAVETIHDVLERGRAGRQRIAGKHGGPPTPFVSVPVVVVDRPGELARLFAAAGGAGVNVEDVAIEHSPGQPVGLVELVVQPDRAEVLAEALRSAGWSVHD